MATRVLPMALVLGAALALMGCGGSPTAPRFDDVFYLHGGGLIDKNASYETYFEKLNIDATAQAPRYVGVGILEGDVRLSRPIDWYVRGADYNPETRFISYQSPRQFLFSIYERIDHPEDSWADVLRRFEGDLRDQGAQILAGRVPVASANAQGRSYLLKTKVAAKPAYQSYSHEILLRSERRLLLVQVVHGENTDTISDEITTALKSILVY
ncbi:MAG: hypothetical protein IPK82_11765 [Polyangiaceae bacterium]|nr:hypothetical protein [Polyangiaceae bacterium]